MERWKQGALVDWGWIWKLGIQYHLQTGSHGFEFSFCGMASDGSLKEEALREHSHEQGQDRTTGYWEESQDTGVRKTGRNKSKCTEVREDPWTREPWIQLLSRQWKQKAMKPPTASLASSWTAPLGAQHPCDCTQDPTNGWPRITPDIKKYGQSLSYKNSSFKKSCKCPFDPCSYLIYVASVKLPCRFLKKIFFFIGLVEGWSNFSLNLTGLQILGIFPSSLEFWFLMEDSHLEKSLTCRYTLTNLSGCTAKATCRCVSGEQLVPSLADFHLEWPTKCKLWQENSDPAIWKTSPRLVDFRQR